MQTLSLSSNATGGRLLNTGISKRLRAFRFLSKRYAQVERESDTAESVLFGLIVLIATWPLVSIIQTIGAIR